MVATLKIVEKLKQKIIRAMCFYNFQNNFLIILSESDPQKERNGRIAQNELYFYGRYAQNCRKIESKNYQNNAFL